MNAMLWPVDLFRTELPAEALFGSLLFGGTAIATIVGSLRSSFSLSNLVAFGLGLYFALCTLMLPTYFAFLEQRDEPS